MPQPTHTFIIQIKRWCSFYALKREELNAEYHSLETLILSFAGDRVDVLFTIKLDSS